MARDALVVIALLAACAGEPMDTKPGDSDVTVDSGPTDTADETGTPETGDSTTPPDTGPFDADGDGFFATDDCDDADPSTYPGATDWCDAKDQDCDGDPIGAGMCGEFTDLLLADATPWWIDDDVVTYITTEWVTSSGAWLAGPSEGPGYGDDPTDDRVLVTRGGSGAIPVDGALWHVEGSYAADFILVAGDFDGDGWDDLVSAGGSPRGTITNAVFLLSGDAYTWPAAGAPLSENALAWWTSYTPADYFGTQVDARADVNGDGLADIVADGIYRETYDYDKGTVHLMLGRTGEMPHGDRANAEVTWWYNTADPNAWDDLIQTYTFVRDADGDGLDDLIANAWDTDGAHLAFASGATLATLDGADVEDVFTLGDAWAGNTRRGETRDGKELGDFDGDGLGDLLTSVSRDDGGHSRREVAVLSGAALGAGATLDDALLTSVTDTHGDSVDISAVGEDFDADGLVDPVATCAGEIDFGPCVLPTSRMPMRGTASVDDMGPYFTLGWGSSDTVADLDQDGIPELYVLHPYWVEDPWFSTAIFSVAEFAIPYDDATKW